jgi:hypothetical protein
MIGMLMPPFLPVEPMEVAMVRPPNGRAFMKHLGADLNIGYTSPAVGPIRPTP